MRFVKQLTGNKTKAARRTANLLSFSPIQKNRPTKPDFF